MPDELDKTWRDHAALATKVATSLVPIVGGPLAELISEAIPRLRQDRMIEYLRQLDKKMGVMEKVFSERLSADEERIDLIETGGHLAARVITTERISHIAEIVVRGLSSDEANFIRRKRLLGLFGEIDDEEFLLLRAYGESERGFNSNAWDVIDRPPPAVLGSSREELDQAKLYEVGKENLLRLGLLERKFGPVKKGEYPEFDARSGGFKSHVGISYLGRMLLREAGIDLGL